MDRSVLTSKPILGEKKAPVSLLTSSCLMSGLRRSTLISILFCRASRTLCTREIGNLFVTASGLVRAAIASAGGSTVNQGHKTALATKQTIIQRKLDAHLVLHIVPPRP